MESGFDRLSGKGETKMNMSTMSTTNIKRKLAETDLANRTELTTELASRKHRTNRRKITPPEVAVHKS